MARHVERSGYVVLIRTKCVFFRNSSHLSIITTPTDAFAGNRKPGGLLQPCQHWEHPDTKRRLHSLLLVSGLYDHLKQIKPSAATRAQLLRFHTGEYVDRIAALSADMGGDAGEHTFMGPGSYEVRVQTDAHRSKNGP